MATYELEPPTNGQIVAWNDPASWTGGVVPNDSTAEVFLSSYPYTYSVEIAAGTAEEVGYLESSGPPLLLSGTLTVDDALGADVQLDGGRLNYDLPEGLGGSVEGAGTISGTDNDGAIIATGGTLAASLESALLGGALAGGTYAALSGGTLELALGGTIPALAATVELGAASDASGSVDTIASVDPATGAIVPLQDSLQQIDFSTGLLALAGQDFEDPNAVTVGGELTLSDGARFSAASITVPRFGEIAGDGTIVGPVVDNGVISALSGAQGSRQLTIKGAVSGSGVLTVGGYTSATPDSGDNFAVLELASAVSANVQFNSAAGALVLLDPEDFIGTITPNIVIDPSENGPGSDQTENAVYLAGLSYADITNASYDNEGTSGILTIVAGATTLHLKLAGDLSADRLVLYAGPTLQNGSTSVVFGVVPEAPVVPTVGLVTASGTVGLGIVNTGEPVLAGTVPSASNVGLYANGYLVGTPATTPTGDGTAATYSSALTTPLTPGFYDIDAATFGLTRSTASGSITLLVLPDPVAGITTADVSSFQIGALRDEGYSLSFVSGTEAIALTDGTLSVGPDTVEASVQRLYEGLLGRGADGGGLAQFTALATVSGTAAVADAILGSPEFLGLHGTPASMGDTAFVTLLYNRLLGRAPDAGGLASHVSALQGGASPASLAAGIADSDEAKTLLAATTGNLWVPDPAGATVTALYETAFGQAPDPGGLALFSTALQGGLSVPQLAAALASSPEFLADHAGQDPAALVTSLYESGLGRAPSAADLQHWAGVTAAGVLFGVAASPEAAVHLIRNV